MLPATEAVGHDYVGSGPPRHKKTRTAPPLPASLRVPPCEEAQGREVSNSGHAQNPRLTQTNKEMENVTV